MPEPLKQVFSRDVVLRFAQSVVEHDAAFDVAAFSERVLDRSWNARELKDRMHHIARNLYDGMSGRYSDRINVLIAVGPQFNGLPALVFPDIVELYGLGHWTVSMRALEAFTPLCSSEFAVRPFIIKDAERMMRQMMKWAKSKNEHVRRLATEGCRPRLPWAIALPEFKKEPAPVIEILEVLRCDSSEYVRRSVANNLNDISKDHPGLVLKIAKRWLREKPETEKLLKHACRTMLKKGDQRALKLFGVAGVDGVKVTGLKLAERCVNIGSFVEFSFTVQVSGKKPKLLRVEYAIDYLKMNGQHGRKEFKISESLVSGKKVITRRRCVRDMTTRIHNPGTHHLHIIVNGHSLVSITFDLIKG